VIIEESTLQLDDRAYSVLFAVVYLFRSLSLEAYYFPLRAGAQASQKKKR
jgi:hypothetical protein